MRDHLSHDRDGRLGRRVAPEVEPDRAVDALDVLAGEAHLDEPLLTQALGAPRAERADVARTGAQRPLQRGIVDLGVVRQHDHRVGPLEVDLGGRVLGPLPDDLVGVRQALRRRELDTRVDHDRPPAELASELADLLGGVDGTDDHETVRGVHGLDEQQALVAEVDAGRLLARDGHAGRLDRGFARGTGEIAFGRVGVEVEHQARPGLGADDGGDDGAAPQLRALRRLHERHPQLAAARQADVAGQLVGDAVVQIARAGHGALEQLLRLAVDGALDAPSGDAAGHLAVVGDREDGADRTGCRAVRADHLRDRDAVSLAAPLLDRLQGVLVHFALLVSCAARVLPSCMTTFTIDSSDARLWPGRNTSTWGRAARMPPASGW